ncbi:lipoprotein-releasing ABC transporter permease subunit [Pokkaliibacter sp. MBI-7]|uniref:lipoprotein-releasing ABC transporter permease subunit n=1 Tax=Pokkaliibacter sp. MBI-7 TaxID=3040600 RepID=UPI002448E38C|nr:lipoprotein-releasing ABC transporter permease subunit [Pokkaliibacter sp. MBI-7]MDH2434936.1 lipoprotein-releasing ABC transporter permease subunit [Pokkaliibacter sp. MBI-7]
MVKSWASWIGLRYTRAKRRNHFISFISAVSMLGLTLGVMVLITVLSVMNGFDREMRERVLGMVPHGEILGYPVMQNWRDVEKAVIGKPGVLGVAPFVQAEGMLNFEGRTNGVFLQGILPEQEPKVSIIKDHITQGSLDALQPGSYGIILGDLLAQFIGARVGDKVTLILPEATATMGGVFPRMKRFEVVGTFSTGAQLDANLALINIEDAAKVKKLGDGVDGVRVKFDDLFTAPQRIREIASALPGMYRVSDWTRTQGNLFQAIKMEKTIMGLLLSLVVAVAAFNIVSTLVMVVTDKTADIAILRTLGATPGDIMKIFMVQGSVIGVVGTASGAILGVILAFTVTDLVNWIQRVFNVQFLDPNVYFISYLPSDPQLQDVVSVCALSLAVSFVATIYPAWRASRTQPAEALRYE